MAYTCNVVFPTCAIFFFYLKCIPIGFFLILFLLFVKFTDSILHRTIEYVHKYTNTNAHMYALTIDWKVHRRCVCVQKLECVLENERPSQIEKVMNTSLLQLLQLGLIFSRTLKLIDNGIMNRTIRVWYIAEICNIQDTGWFRYNTYGILYEKNPLRLMLTFKHWLYWLHDRSVNRSVIRYQMDCIYWQPANETVASIIRSEQRIQQVNAWWCLQQRQLAKWKKNRHLKEMQ